MCKAAKAYFIKSTNLYNVNKITLIFHLITLIWPKHRHSTYEVLIRFATAKTKLATCKFQQKPLKYSKLILTYFQKSLIEDMDVTSRKPGFLADIEQSL